MSYIKCNILLATIILLIGCNNEKPVTREKSSVESFNVEQLLAPLNLVATKDFLIIVNDNPDTLFHIYRVPDMTHFTYFGKVGKSANEFLMVKACRELMKKNSFFVSDAGKKQLTLFDIEQDKPINTISTNEICYQLSNGLSYNGNGSVCVNNMTPQSNIIEIIDIQNNKISKQIDIKDSQDDLMEESVLSYCGDVVMCAYTYTDKVKFVNATTGKELRTNSIKTPINKDNPIYFYVDADNDGNYFYALYIGSGASDIANATSVIHVYDMDGILVKVIELDALVGRFSIGSNSFVYGISPLNPSAILRFKI